MIFQNIEIHGCTELESLENGAYGTMRVPISVHEKLSDNGKNQNKNNTGIEFRFVINSGDAKLSFRYEPGKRAEITVYYGEFVADWPETTKNLEGDCEITIIQSNNIAHMRKIAAEYGHRFSPDVVRLVVRGARPQIVSVEGDVSLPTPDMCPKRKYLAYGSSITHGSIALHPYYNYVERVAANLGADVLNLGFAGSACLESAMADFMANECDFDFATLEMGINILGIEPEDFEARVRYFVGTIAKAHPSSKIFAVDVYYCRSDIVNDGRADCFREIVKRVTEEFDLPNIVYVNGKTVLTSPARLSSGLVHPNPDGVHEMAENLTKIISENM